MPTADESDVPSPRPTPSTGRLAPLLRESRIRRDIAMLAIGTLFGSAFGVLVAMTLDDDPTPTPGASDPAATESEAAADQPAIDPTDTEFGQLTDGATGGVKVQWQAEIIEGPETGTVEFVAAHREGTTVLVAGDVRVMDDGKTIRVCAPGCETADAKKALAALPELVRPFWEGIRSVEETTAAPTYRITGETQLESGIFERCGQYDPKAFGLTVPSNVVSISQCVDAQRNVPLRIGLNGDQRGVGGASLMAIADAEPDLFKT